VHRAGLPGFVVVGLQSHIKLTIEKSGGIGAIVRATKLRADDGDHRILDQDVTNLRGESGGVLESDSKQEAFSGRSGATECARGHHFPA
jgi:hypothetical protein